MLVFKLLKKRITQLKKIIMPTVHKPLIVILGATGAGKSKLALDIGEKINGEIINADAMQMYQGLDIVTNKVTPEEMKICSHHMIGFLSPLDKFTVVDFQKQTLKLIDDIHKRNRVPILVGGTNYYIESILWNCLIQSNKTEKMTSSMNEFRKDFEEMSSFELHKKLEEVDPVSASTIHPQDKRKVLRSLEIFYQTGKPMSECLQDQRKQSGASNVGGPLRFPESCVIWVQCEKDVLLDRINRRVDKMLTRGLLNELADFHKQFNKNRPEHNYENGIFQSIGFKEFHEYLTNEEESETLKQKLLLQGIERMKLSTWQYAKYQEKWIRKRIVNRPVSVPVYPVDGSDPDQWSDLVTYPALRLLQSFYSSYPLIMEKLKDFDYEGHIIPRALEKTKLQLSDDHRVFKKCDVCGGKLISSHSWNDHLKSRNHKRMYGLLKKHQSETVRILNERQKQLKKSGTLTINHETLNETDLKLFEEESL